MARLRWLPTARADLLDIFESIALQAGSADVGEHLVTQIRERCRELASLPGTMGRPRPELRPDIRSVAFKNHVIFFRYKDGFLEIVNVVHGRRDIDSLF